MTKETRAKKSELIKHRVAARHGALDMVESYFPAGSPQRSVAGIGGAALAALLAAALLGVGPAALAGAAGYVVYQETHR